MAQLAITANIMKPGITRSILRWIHIVLSIPILGYIYSPFEEIAKYAPLFALSSFPYLSFRDFGCGKVTSFDDLFHKDRWAAQLTLSAAKMGARVGAVYEKTRPGGICLCIHR